MAQATEMIRNDEACSEDGWPPLTRAVSYVGSACVIQGSGDFDPNDLAAVRRRFPDRYVSLDGDVITVWPPCGPAR
ncbi:hypothetical protein ACWD3I_38115 [Streptomyces sp. NPDC002817]|uniref:hypothetical protein n=1 Tax=Streptomyces sp. NPDC088357 TaxID=3154655 RepID=UPI0034231EBD